MQNLAQGLGHSKLSVNVSYYHYSLPPNLQNKRIQGLVLLLPRPSSQCHLWSTPMLTGRHLMYIPPPGGGGVSLCSQGGKSARRYPGSGPNWELPAVWSCQEWSFPFYLPHHDEQGHAGCSVLTEGGIDLNFSRSHHLHLVQGCWKAMNPITDWTGKCACANRVREGLTSCVKTLVLPPNTVQGYVLVSMVTKSSLAWEDLVCKQPEVSLWLPCPEGGIAQEQGRGRWSTCRLPGAEEAFLPENEFHRYRNLPAFILGTQNFEQSFSFFFKDITF